MKRSAMGVAAVLLISGLICGRLEGQTPVVWDGGNGVWSDANWNGGQTLGSITGDSRGTAGGHAIMIGGASEVAYPGDTIRDLRLRIDNGPASLTITEGATLNHNSFDTDGTDVDGMWTQMDGDLILDNGTFRRTYTDQTENPSSTTLSGGLLMFGSWRSLPDQVIRPNLVNGGRFENDGQVWFGGHQEHAPGLKVLMTINDGSLDFTGGAYPQDNDGIPVFADLAFFYGHDFSAGECNGCVGDNSLKNEEYKINFKGPGSITVDDTGIHVWEQDEFNIWTDNMVTYEDLWTRGILRSDGVSGGAGGANFGGHFTVTGTSGSSDYTLTRKDPVSVAWDGGNGSWSDANWNGAQALGTVTGDGRGTAGGHDIIIGGGAEVSYAADTIRDLRLRVDNGPASLTITEGATLNHNSFDTDGTDVDGMWTQMDGDLILDNGTLRRTYTDQTENPSSTTLSGGLLMFGSWRSRPGQEIDVEIKNGGRFENDGQVWFGGHQEHAPGLKVTMTIDDGTLDLTGGAYPQDNDGIPVFADLAFFYGHDFSAGECNGCTGMNELKNEEYIINFTGPGSITVDESGIHVWEQDEFNIWTDNMVTYEDLWTRGILQANGESGLTGAMFSTYFTTMGMSGMDDYALTSLVAPPGLPGDYNGNGIVDAADYTLWRNNLGSATSLLNDDTPGVDQDDFERWVANFGNTLGSGAGVAAVGGAVPEPSSLALVGLACGLLAGGLVRRRAA